MKLKATIVEETSPDHNSVYRKFRRRSKQETF